MSRLEDLTELHRSLASLTADERCDETRFQQWFEANPIVFGVLGFKRVIAKPRLQLCDGGYYEPDFMVKDWAGVWSIFELKRPDTTITKNPSRRTDFRAEFSTYLQQCREYAAFFLDAANRAQFDTNFGETIQRYVPGTIVAAIDNEVDRLLVHDLLFDRGNSIQLLTFSDVLATIVREIERMTQDEAGLPGHYVAILGIFPRESALKSQLLFDFGTAPDKNRLSVGGTPRSFFVELLDDEGNKNRAEVDRPLVVEYANSSELTLLEVEFGVGKSDLYLAVHVNRKCVYSKRSTRVPLRTEPLDHLVIASDMYGRVPADFSAVEIVVYRRTLTWAERQQFYRRLDAVYSYYLSPLAIHLPLRMTFSGNQWAASLNHPVAPGATKRSNGPMSLDSRRPWAWYVASGGMSQHECGPSPVDPRVRETELAMPGM